MILVIAIGLEHVWCPSLVDLVRSSDRARHGFEEYLDEQAILTTELTSDRTLFDRSCPIYWGQGWIQGASTPAPPKSDQV